MARVSLVDPKNANKAVKNYFKGFDVLFGGTKPANSHHLVTHSPHVAKFLVIIAAVLQREGAGSILSGQIKAVADIKTSAVNTCAY